MIRRRVTLPTTSDRVWGAITDPRHIPSWFGGEMDWSLEPGAPLSYRGDDGELREGRIEEVRPGARLRFVWWPADDGGGAVGEGATEVTYLVEPAPDGAVLTVQETPLVADGPRASTAPGTAGRRWDDWDDRLAGAWVSLSTNARTGARA